MSAKQVGGAASGASAGAQAGTAVLPGIGTAIGAVIGAVVGWLSSGSGKSPAAFTGLDVSGAASGGALTTVSYYGNAKNNSQAFRYATEDHGTMPYFNDLLKKEYDRISDAATTLGYDPASLAKLSVPFQFTVTKNGNQGIGPRTEEIVDDFTQQILPGISDRLAEAIMPGVGGSAGLFALADRQKSGLLPLQNAFSGSAAGQAPQISVASAGSNGAGIVLASPDAAPSSGGLGQLALLAGAFYAVTHV